LEVGLNWQCLIIKQYHNHKQLDAISMAEPEVATKAPESDAVEASLIPGDTPAESGASLGVRGSSN
jgi:hypothetical protein